MAKRLMVLVAGMMVMMVMSWLVAAAKPAMLPPSATPNGGVTLSLSAFASGLTEPVSLAHAGDSRLFVVEQAGIIKIIQSNGTVLGTPFLNITDRVDAGSEEGLLGLTFHPDYINNGHFYVNYTNITAGVRRTRISRFQVTANANVADPNSEQILLTVIQHSSNHNAGDIHFGPDGYLYVPLGDGVGG
ncbi:MAG: PQQ-dependent sugar dehydrogenase [Chloroflexi bacterium]|nr:PQQ-dependent sugar dehydrogenase [Chloroflexota bacterium]